MHAGSRHSKQEQASKHCQSTDARGRHLSSATRINPTQCLRVCTIPNSVESVAPACALVRYTRQQVRGCGHVASGIVRQQHNRTNANQRATQANPNARLSSALCDVMQCTSSDLQIRHLCTERTAPDTSSFRVPFSSVTRAPAVPAGAKQQHVRSCVDRQAGAPLPLIALVE